MSSDHGDINRYDRRKRLALAYVPNTYARDRVTGGSYLSGRLGDPDKTQITYIVKTLAPRLGPPPPPDVQTEPPPAKAEDPQPAPRPDLVISAMDDREPDKYSFTVANRGPAAAGASATRTFRTMCKVGTQEAIADSLSQVAESDETNNRRSFAEDVCII